MISAAQKAALLLLKLFSKVKLGVPYKMTNRGIAVFSGSNAVVAKILENKTAVFGQDVPIDLRISGNLVLDLSGSTAPGYLYILNEGSASITSELIGQISASNVIVQPSGNLISNNTQDSLYELQADVDNIFATRGIIREIQAGSNIGVIDGTSATASIFLSSSLTNITSIQTQELTASFVNASTAFLTNITGNLLGTASFATNADNANTVTNGVYTNTNNTFTAVNTFSNFYITGSITGSDAKFTTISGSHTGSGAGLFNITASGISNFTNDVRGQFSAGTNILIVSGVISSTSTTTPGGTNTTIQFNSGSAFSGSTSLVFDYTNNILSGTVARFTTVTASLIGTSSFATNAGNASTVTNGVYTNINNTFTAVNTFAGFYITGSITGSDAKFITVSGSHTGSGAGLFGIPNTGLVNSSVTVGTTNISLGGTTTTLQGITVLTGSTVTGSIALFTQITGNLFGTSSFATNAGNANTVTNGVYTNTNNTFTAVNTFSNFYITGSITGSDAKFTTISGSHTGSGAGLFGIPNNGLVNSSITIGTTNIALGATATTIQGINVLTGSTITGSIAQFTQITASSIRTAYITSSNIDTDYIDFNGINGEAPWQTGRLYYNTASNLLSVYTEVPGLHIHLGEQVVSRVQNDLPITLVKGKVIQITGSSSSDTPRVITASWENDATSARTLAVVMEDIAVGARGYALLSGLLEGINTNAYQPGQMLYLSSSGDMTNIQPPAPFHEVRIGQVVRKQTNNGSIFIRIQNGYELEELHDVDLVNVQNGDLLTYQTSPYNQWVNSKTLSGSYNITNALTASNIIATTISASQYIGITAGATPGGIDTSIQFNSGSSLSGSANLVYDYNTNILSGTTAQFSTITASLIGTASFATNAGNANTVTNGVYTNTNNTFTAVNTFSNFYITGSITGSDAKFTTISGSHTGSGAGLFGIPNTGLVNSSVTVGSTNIPLGGTATTIQGVTVITGSTVTGSTALFTQITGNLFGTSSFAANAGNANTVTNGVYTNTNNTFTAVNTFSNFYITGSITGSDAKFASITGSHAGSGAGLTNIPNTGLVNSSVTIGSTNIALGGTATTLQGITVLTGSTVTGSIALFSQITGAFSGNGANITNITASNISNFTNDVRSQFSAGTNITIVGGVISSTGGGGGGTPGGTDQAVQFNSGSTFSGSTNLVYNYNTNTLSGTVAQFTVITSSFTGSGAGLFNLTASGINNFTNDVRGQFSAGANITIAGGVISATTGSVIGSVITVTGNYIVLTTDDRIFTNGTLTLTLPSAVGSSGKSYYIKNIGTGSVTITGTLGEKIDGYDNMIITEQNSALGLLSNNIGWYIF